MSNTCPVCGADSLRTIAKKQSVPVVYGEPASFEKTTQICDVCGEEGDFFEVNDEIIAKAINQAVKQSVASMLDDLSKNGLKMAYIERALQLPVRTIARWKAGELSAGTVALLRTIRTFPWLLEVADSNFDRNVANNKVIEQALNIFNRTAKQHVEKIEVDITNGLGVSQITASFHLKKNLKQFKPTFQLIQP